MRVQGKVIVVTGGVAGIGRALCRRFAQEGAKAVVVADINLEGAKAVAGEIDGLAIKCDVRKEEEIIDVVKQTGEKMGSEAQVYMEHKAADYDCWLNGMRRLQKRFER